MYYITVYNCLQRAHDTNKIQLHNFFKEFDTSRFRIYTSMKQTIITHDIMFIVMYVVLRG